MGVKPGYKQTDVGVIPEEWETRPLKQITSNMLQGVNTAIDKPEYVHDGIPMLKANNVIDGEVIFVGADHISQKTFSGYSDRFKANKNDFLFSNIGARLGTGSLLKLDVECSFAWNVMRIVPDTRKITPEYLCFLINSPKYSEEIKSKQSGSGMGFVPKGVMQGIVVALPKRLEEQRAIAGALSDVDALIGALDAALAKKRDLKQAAMQQLLTGQKRLPGFHGEWAVNTVAELEKQKLVKLSRGQVISKKDIDNTPGDFPIYSSSIHNDGLFGRYGDFMFDEELITWSVDGGGNFFHRRKHKFSVTNVCGFMRVDTSRIDYRFFAAELQLLHSRKSFDYQSKAHPSVVRKEYEVQLPPLPEQTAIAEVLTEMDMELAALEQRREKTRALKQGMMQELLTGRTRLV